MNPLFWVIENMPKKKIDVSVNLKRGTATVRITYEHRLFDNPAGRFIIEGDAGGFSCIEKREDGYYKVNYLRKRDYFGNYTGDAEAIEKKKISSEKAKEIIEEILKFKYEE